MMKNGADKCVRGFYEFYPDGAKLDIMFVKPVFVGKLVVTKSF